MVPALVAVQAPSRSGGFDANSVEGAETAMVMGASWQTKLDKRVWNTSVTGGKPESILPPGRAKRDLQAVGTIWVVSNPNQATKRKTVKGKEERVFG